MTTLQPRAPYSDAELAQLYPPELRLQQVQILLRHGERTPVGARFQNTGLPAYWPYCTAVRQLRSAVLGPSRPGGGADAVSVSKGSGTFSDLEWRRRLETFGPSNDEAVPAEGPKGELDGICDFGMLTDRGRETTYALGARLRKLYIDHLGFIPASIKDADSFYLRTTPVPRALESLQQAFLGLYPPHTRAADFPPLTITSRTLADETLFPNDGNCRRFAALARAFAQRAADHWNNTKEMDYLTKKIGKWMPEGQSPRVAVDSHPRLSGIMDTINATSAHGPATLLPKEFYDPKAKEIMEKIGVEEWFAGYKESREYRTLGIGGLVGDITARMVDTAQRNIPDPDFDQQPPPGQGGQQEGNPSSARFGLSGCHDTTLAGVLASLGAFNTDAWPPFTSHIAIELFRSAAAASSSSPPALSTSSWWPSFLGGSRGNSTSPKGTKPTIGRKPTPSLTEAERKSLQGYFVRLRYNDTPVTIPGCKPQGSHLEGDESFCTLEAFKAIVDKFTPRDWKAECRANVKGSAFPVEPEPAGY